MVRDSALNIWLLGASAGFVIGGVHGAAVGILIATIITLGIIIF